MLHLRPQLPDAPDRRMQRLIAEARLRANANAPYTGFGSISDQTVIQRCHHTFKHHDELAVQLIFTRDAGMHSSGWWKNPDYERCEHLSLSFFSPRDRLHLPHDRKAARLWCIGFWGSVERCRHLWIEGPQSAKGQRMSTWHYRLFLAPDWRLPIIPRGEVYTREFTAAGWQSWSDVHAPGEALDDMPP